MVRGLPQAARPCVQQWARQAHSIRSWCARSAFTTASRSQYAALAIPRAAATAVEYVPSTKPPSARPVETRKTQMIRAYTSMLRSTPLILFFQHNNLTAVEWASIRRELDKALRSVPPSNGDLDIADQVKLSVLRTNMLDVALKIIEFHDAEAASASASTPRTAKGPLVHDLSAVAYDTIKNTPIPTSSAYAQIEPLLVGPLAALTIPAVSPQHLAAALSVLSPVPKKFPAPKKSKNPGYHEPTCQSALAKLFMVGGRIEGRIFDQAGVQWVGAIDGGLDGLRAQLVHLLQSAGLGVTTALEGGSKSLWLTLESRRAQLDEGNGDKPNEGNQVS